MNTRTTLLDVAEQAARSRGFDAFSYADLSDAVGIRKASIHHHFPAKADLALALINRYRENFLSTLAGIDDKNPTAGERLSGFLRTYRDALSDGQTVCLCVAYSSGRDSFQAPVIDELDAFHSDCLSWLETVFDQACQDKTIKDPGPAQMEAKACLALVEGAQLMARAAKNPNRYDEATALLKSRIANSP